MSYSTSVIRRWNSAPLDPTPPTVVRSELDPMLIPPTIYDESSRTINTETIDAANETTRHSTDSGQIDVVLASPTTTPTSEKKDVVVASQSIEKGGDTKGNINIKEGQRGRGWGRGIRIDFNNTIRKYWLSEMTNLNQKTIAVSFFLFFACISPAITFGAVYGKATHNHIGAVEMLVATAWCGIVYSLIGGQPMMINGGTGPVLAFTEILYKMSLSMDVPFLTFNAWISLWICFFMCISAVGSLNRIIAYATRFTDEIFALLIATIFIINALYNPFSPTGVFYYFQDDHKSHEEHSDNPDYSVTATALLSLIVCIGTVQVAFALRKVKFSPFLPTQGLRNTITDFAVVTSILIWTLIAGLAFSHVPMETLNVPDTFAPTFVCCTEACELSWPEDCPDIAEPYGRRSWMVDLTDLNGNGWVPFAAAGPALLAFILVFLDDGITWHLINHPAHKLTHGEAFDYDTVIIGLMAAINGLFGLPILVAATVRSLNHVHALAEKSPDGRILSVQETRLTDLFIHGLILASLFVLEVLKLIPMPVLYGVFLFMGLVSLGSNTLWNRTLMFFMQPSKYPLEPYTLHMRPRRMHLFTAIQLGLFALLYTVKAIKTIAIAFPLIIAMCIPIRLYILPKIFTEKELVVIDSDDDAIKKWLAAHQIDQDEDEEDDDSIIKKGHGHDEGGGIERDQTEGRRREKQLSHHAGEDNEFFVKDLIEDNKESNNVGEGILIDIEKGEESDKVHPLPPEEAIRNRATTRRRNRKKSLSCPTTHLMFAETPHGIVPEIGLADHVVGLDSTATQSEEGESSSGQQQEGSSPPAIVAPRPRRRRRAKSLSCPTHLLYAEADRHVAENYFFG